MYVCIREIKKRIERVWNGHGADSEIGNVSARQAALKRWTASRRQTSVGTESMVSRWSVVTSVEPSNVFRFESDELLRADTHGAKYFQGHWK